MSGRSAYVRKKITETQAGEKGSVLTRGRAKSPESLRSSDRDDLATSEYPLPPGTGYGTTNARFLKFSEPIRDTELTNFSNHSSGSQSGDSAAGRREAGTAHQNAPMPEFAYARARKPVIKTEDVSGIERSGFRSALDKRSEEVRKGISKAFTFGKKNKQGGTASLGHLDLRPQSDATIRAYHDPDQSDYVESPSVPVPNLPHALIWDLQMHGAALSPPPSAKLPPIPPPSSMPPIKRWIGAGRPVQRWNKLRKDPELWDPNGDVLVFFGQKGQSPRPNPSFRLSSHIIEATESRFLITLLREGSTEEDIHMPPSPVGAPPMLPRHGSQMHAGYGHGRGGQPTPPISEDTSLGEADGQISYEMYFPTPSNMTKTNATLHHVATRNVFALLYHASLVGLSLCQALSDLHARLQIYMPSDNDNVGTILNYLSARGIDDPQNDVETAVSLLAWSESPEVRWEEGWREAFLHCAGMYDRVDQCADFKSITPITRALLERACLETQLRVQAAEERLATFGYGDIWPSSGPIATGPARAAADRLQQFLTAYYTKIYSSWPPPECGARTTDGEDMWLTRTVAQRLQKDFGALYDYLVNRDIIWDESETRSSRKWMMVSESGNRAFDPDTADLPLTDMLIEFDNRMRFPHIPHPYPLVPDSIPPVTAPGAGRDKSKKGDKDKDKEKNKANDDRILERRVQLAYTEATNIYVLGSEFTHSDLIENFVKFEKSDQIGAVDPSAARRGRWVLIYGILQTLASVSVDSPNVRYKDSVAYHLSPRLKGTKTPPWKGVSSRAVEAAHELSYCWIAPRLWNSNADGAESDASVNSGHASPVLKMIRAQAQKFPRPPQTITNRSSNNAGWHTPATRSIRSNDTGVPPTMWGGSSAVSTVSDDASSSIRTPTSSQYRARSRDGTALKSVRSQSTIGTTVGKAGEEEGERGGWPVRSQSIRGAGVSRVPPPLTNHASFTGHGGFLNFDQSPEMERGREMGMGNNGRSILSGGGSSDGLGPVIRDFDELSVVDDHEP